MTHDLPPHPLPHPSPAHAAAPRALAVVTLVAAAAVFAATALVAGTAAAAAPVETAASGASAAASSADDSLHRALGGQAGIARVVDDLTQRMVDDRRTATTFKGVDLAKFRERLAAQLCQVAGGPCVYTGKDMKTVHDGVDITRAHFNAVVELLQDSMDAQGIAFGDQNRLLARLAPMHREIVNAVPGQAPAAAVVGGPPAR